MCTPRFFWRRSNNSKHLGLRILADSTAGAEGPDHRPWAVERADGANQRDQGTPLANARTLRSALDDRARMVTVDQGGHGVYLFGTNQCGNTAVTDFLVRGKRPKTDMHCAAETH